MKDASGASQFDKKTEVASLHGVSMLAASCHTLESNLCLALLHETGTDNDHALVNVVVGAAVHLHGDPLLAAAQAARDAGNAPNAVLCAALSILGPRRVDRARRLTEAFIDAFAKAGLSDARGDGFDFAAVNPEPGAGGPLETPESRSTSRADARGGQGESREIGV